MTANLYCSRRDVTRWLPSGEIAGSSRLASVVGATDVFTLDGHGLETNDAVMVRAAEGTALPSPLVEGTYYAIRLTNGTFQLKASIGGSAVNVAASSSDVFVVKEPPYDDVIEFYSRWADGFMPGNLVPFTEPVPAIVKGLVAELAAKKLLNLDGKSSEIQNAAELAAKAMLERFAKGLPVRDAAATGPANLAISDAAVGATDTRGWGSGCLP